MSHIVNNTEFGQEKANPEHTTKITESLHTLPPEAQGNCSTTLEKIVGYQHQMSPDQASYLASLTDQYRQSGQSPDVFLANLAQDPNTASRAEYLTKLSPETKQALFDATPKTPDQIIAILDPTPPDDLTQSDKLSTILSHESTATAKNKHVWHSKMSVRQKKKIINRPLLMNSSGRARTLCSRRRLTNALSTKKSCSLRGEYREI